MDYNEFAERIKTKYPQYKDLDNRDLAQRMVEKYPNTYDVTFDESPSSTTLEGEKKSKEDELNEEFKQRWQNELNKRNQWETEHPIISGYQKSLDPFYRERRIDMENYAKYGLHKPLDVRLKEPFQKAASRLPAAANLATMALTGGQSLPVQGAVQGAVDALGRDIADNGVNLTTPLKVAQEAGIGALTGGIVKFGSPIGTKANVAFRQALNRGKKAFFTNPVFQKVLGSAAELYANIPKKYFNLAYNDIINNGGKLLREEVSENPYTKGTEMYRNAIDKISEKKQQIGRIYKKLSEKAERRFPTNEQYKQQYKALGQQAKKKLQASAKPATFYAKEYEKMGNQALDAIKSQDEALGNEVQAAIGNLEGEKLRIDPAELQETVTKLFDKYQRGYTNTARNVTGNLEQRYYDMIENAVKNSPDGYLDPLTLQGFKETSGSFVKDWTNPDAINYARNIDKDFYLALRDKLNTISGDLSKANAAYSNFKDLQNAVGGLNASTIGGKLEQYGSPKQIESGISEALEELNNALPKEKQFLDKTQKLQAQQLAQEQLQKNLGSGIFNDISRYENAPFETQDALSKIAPNELQQYLNLKNLQNESTIGRKIAKDIRKFGDINTDTEAKEALLKYAPKEVKRFENINKFENEQNQILTPSALPRNLRGNAQSLLDKYESNDLTQSAVDYLQDRTGLNFMDELERARVKDIFNSEYWSGGGGFGGKSGFKNYVVNDALDVLPPVAKQVAKSKLRSVNFYRNILDGMNNTLNPISIESNVLAPQGLQKLYQDLGQPIPPGLVPMLYGTATYNTRN